MTNRRAFTAAIGQLSAVFGELSAAATEAYWTACAEMSDAEFAEAARRGLRKCKFMPKPVELLALARPSISPEAHAELAWSTVRETIDAVDYTSNVDFGPVVNHILRAMGGWEYLTDCGEDDLNTWKRKDFIEHFQRVAAMPQEYLRGDPLRGGLEVCNTVIIAIPGMPARPQELPEIGNVAGDVADMIRNLADGKS